MAKCILIVLAMSMSVFARDCERVLSNKFELSSNLLGSDYCDECIRCGGKWCYDIDMVYQHCKMGSVADGWCSDKLEGSISETEDTSLPGTTFQYKYLKSKVSVGNVGIEEIEIREPPSSPLKAYANILSPPQLIGDRGLKVVVMNGDRLVVTTPVIKNDFCSPNATNSSSFIVKAGLQGYSEEVTLEFEVPCACECSRKVKKNSPECNNHGDFACGICRCEENWEGKRCERKKCPTSDRGDIGMETPSCYSASKPNEVCSGNGRCDTYCNICECYNDVSIEGSQYFHPDTHCEDICSMTSKCVDCLQNPEPGVCDCDYIPRIFMNSMNESRLQETEKGRKIWVQCNTTVPECGVVSYAAMRSTEVEVMVMSSCDPMFLAAGSQPIMVPVGVTIAILLAAVAGVAGYMAYKSRLPALQPAAPQYSNIGGEDSVGVNPLYVDPTSSFKNPMYGKAG